MEWKFFSDAMPECNERLVVTFHDSGAEEAFDEGELNAADWFYVKILVANKDGFGLALYDDEGKLSRADHESIMQTGRWIYAHDIATSNFATERFTSPDCQAMVVEHSALGALHRPVPVE